MTGISHSLLMLSTKHQCVNLKLCVCLQFGFLQHLAGLTSLKYVMGDLWLWTSEAGVARS